MREDHSMCHEPGCSLAHIPYQLASCGCIHAGWMARATAAEAREAALVTKIEEIRDVSPVGSDAHVLAIAALQETTDAG